MSIWLRLDRPPLTKVAYIQMYYVQGFASFHEYFECMATAADTVFISTFEPLVVCISWTRTYLGSFRSSYFVEKVSTY